MARLALLVTPRAGRQGIGPMVDGVLRVRVTRPPAEGEANVATIDLLARELRLPRARISVVSGRRSRRKVVELAGVSEADLARRLERLAD